MNRMWHNSFLGLSVARELFALLDTAPGVREPDTPDTHSLDGPQAGIEFQGVSFSYNADTQVLRDVNMKIAPGMAAAISGRSGAGKSTVINLLLRFYDPSSGVILLNGVDIKEYGIEYLQSKIAVVFQDSFLFSGTIRENIRMARPDASDDAVAAAAKSANAHGFISALPDGYDTVISERGSNLSGGERQRVSIARAVLKDAPILLLDEATSSVDMESERLIQESLAKLMENRTSITIAHRAATIQNADRVFVIEDGRLSAQGGHGPMHAEPAGSGGDGA
jgi:ABC-type multidrug transport system fused ATPase/permease subunit